MSRLELAIAMEILTDLADTVDRLQPVYCHEFLGAVHLTLETVGSECAFGL